MGLYFEDFELGGQFKSPSVVVTREMITAFATLTGDDNPLHVGSEFMRRQGLGDVIAHGLLIESLAIGLIAKLGVMTGTTIALLEASARFVKSVVPGDAIRVVMSIEDKRETSKPDRGVLFRRVDVLNQDDEVVSELALVSLMRRSPSGTSDLGEPAP